MPEHIDVDEAATPVLYSLHWLPVQFRIGFKILIITFKAIYGHAPEYLRNLIHIKNSSMNGLRSNSELLLAPPSTETKKTLGDSAFTAAGPSLWNKLPSEIRDEDNFERFKSKLKTFLLRAAYPTKSTWYFILLYFILISRIEKNIFNFLNLF